MGRGGKKVKTISYEAHGRNRPPRKLPESAAKSSRETAEIVQSFDLVQKEISHLKNTENLSYAKKELGYNNGREEALLSNSNFYLGALEQIDALLPEVDKALENARFLQKRKLLKIKNTLLRDREQVYRIYESVWALEVGTY